MTALVRPSLLAVTATALLLLTSTATAATITVKAGDDLQAALHAAQPGDTLLLQAGATFTGNFVLPVKAGSAYITVRTSTADDLLPGPTARIRPEHAPLLARIVSPNTMPALRTAAGAHHWRLLLLEFGANREGYSEIIQLGDGSSVQNQPAQVPYELELDRVYIHGDPLMGQKRGVALNARSVTIRNCHISDIKAVGMDTQAIGGWNGPGPFVIENNYLEAAGENVMFGGADPFIANLVSEDVTIRGNHFSRPMSWREPMVPTPVGLSGTASTGGALAAGTHSYRVVARRRIGGGVVARSTASTEISVTVAAGGVAHLTWTAVPDTLEYYVYGRSPAGVSQNWTATSNSFTDTGAAGRSGAAPASKGDLWTVKNLLELKNARRVRIERNLFENHWAGGQSGYSIVFTPRNQDGACSWCVVEDVTFEYNVVRNAAAGVNILGYDDIAPSQQTKNLRIRHNLFQLTTALGGSAWLLLVGNGPSDITVDHNTLDSNGTTVMYVYGAPSGGILPISRFQFTNNAARHRDYGMNGADAAFGNGVITAYFPEGTVRGNWLEGGYASRYPADNYFNGTFASAFVGADSGDYSAAPGGPLASRATDGTHIGADFAVLSQVITAALSGNSPPRPALTPPGNLRRVK